MSPATDLPDFRQLTLDVYARNPLPHPVFQPRFEPWFDWQRRAGNVPPPYAAMDVTDLYREIGCSMRYMHYYTSCPSPIQIRYADDVTIQTEERRGGRERLNQIRTPHGTLHALQEWTIDKTWRTVEFYAEDPSDYRALRWLLERVSYHFNPDIFRRGQEYLGTLGEPQFWVPKCPYQALIQTWSTLECLVFALADDPVEVKELMDVIDHGQNSVYQEIIESGLVRIVNFGENIHEQLCSPDYIERFFFPYYEKRVAQLKGAGIYTHVHLDGYFKNLLPLLSRFPQDGIEALTPLPQGDVSIAEMAAHLGDKILLDGIPAVLFLPTYSRDRLIACVDELIDRLHPRLILGVSDEVPQACPFEEGLERLKLVARHCLQRRT